MGDGSNFVLCAIEGGVLELDATEVRSQESQCLAAHPAVEVLESLLVLLRDTSLFGVGLKLGLELGEARLGLVTLKNSIELLATAEGGNDTTLVNVLVVCAEEVVGALKKHAILGHALSAVPPRADQVRQEDTEEECIGEDNELAVAVRDDELGERNTDAEALLSVGVAILDVVVADLLVGERLVGL